MNFTVSTLGVPVGFCFTNWTQAWPTLVSLLEVSSGDFNGIVDGNTPPAAVDRDKPWFRRNADGTPDGWYGFASGSWLKKAELPAPGVGAMWWGAEVDIVTLDGGEAGAISATTGAFWEKVSAMDGRFPLGPGTLNGAAVAVGATGGAGTVELEIENIPRHDHGFGGKRVLHQLIPAGGGDFSLSSGNQAIASQFTSDGGNPDNSTEPHANVPPYLATFFIRRTGRLYHRA